MSASRIARRSSSSCSAASRRTRSGGELLVAQLGLSPKPSDQRLLAILVRAHVTDVVLARVHFGVQPPKFRALISFLFHRVAILSDHGPRVHPPNAGAVPS